MNKTSPRTKVSALKKRRWARSFSAMLHKFCLMASVEKRKSFFYLTQFLLTQLRRSQDDPPWEISDWNYFTNHYYTTMMFVNMFFCFYSKNYSWDIRKPCSTIRRINVPKKCADVSRKYNIYTCMNSDQCYTYQWVACRDTNEGLTETAADNKSFFRSTTNRSKHPFC